MDKHNIKKIKLCYFGWTNPAYYGIEYEDLSPQETKGDIAISVTNLQGIYYVDHNRYAWLKNYEPVERIGYSIYVYHIK
jgi:hypothetical protein